MVGFSNKLIVFLREMGVREYDLKIRPVIGHKCGRERGKTVFYSQKQGESINNKHFSPKVWAYEVVS